MASEKFKLPSFADTNEIRAIFDIWDGWRGDALVPSRASVKLRDLSQYMEAVILFDVVNPDTITIRYFGSLFMDYFGMDYTGKNFMDLTEEGMKPLRSKRICGLTEQPCAAVWTTRALSYGVEREFSVGLSVPIAENDGDEASQILQVCLPFKGTERPVFSKAEEARNINLSDRYKFVDIGAGTADVDVEYDIASNTSDL